MITSNQYQYIQRIGAQLGSAVNKFKAAALRDKKYYDQIGLIDAEKELVNIDPGFSEVSITSRWDSFLEGDELKYVELNAECPAGIAYSDVAAKVYDELPFVKTFKKSFHIEKFKIRQTLLDRLMATWGEFNGVKKNKKPNIAIVDWREVPTYTEFQLFQEFFISKGFSCIIADPRDLEYSGGRLRSKDFEIDLVYKRILTNDCVERPAETANLVAAYRDKNICMVNPFRAKLVHKKSLFASLTHEKNHSLFSISELNTIAKHIPWTRMMANEKTRFKGRTIDLTEYVSTHKDDFVIKPNDEYGGKGVYLGKETDSTQWEKVIKDALSGELYVVQELVKIPRQKFPTLTNGKLTWVDMVVDMDPYTFGAVTEGALTRLSASSLANVTAGGGTTPTFVIREKEKKKKVISIARTPKSGTKARPKSAQRSKLKRKK